MHIAIIYYLIKIKLIIIFMNLNEPDTLYLMHSIAGYL